MTVTPDLRFEVSRLIRHYYVLHGKLISAPTIRCDGLNPTALSWNNGALLQGKGYGEPASLHPCQSIDDSRTGAPAAVLNSLRVYQPEGDSLPVARR
jgi:hypothetical protein